MSNLTFIKVQLRHSVFAKSELQFNNILVLSFPILLGKYMRRSTKKKEFVSQGCEEEVENVSFFSENK